MLHAIIVCLCFESLSERLGCKKAIARGEDSQLLGLREDRGGGVRERNVAWAALPIGGIRHVAGARVN